MYGIHQQHPPPSFHCSLDGFCPFLLCSERARRTIPQIAEFPSGRFGGGDYVDEGYVRYDDDGEEIPADEEDVQAATYALLHPSPAFRAKYHNPGSASNPSLSISASANAICFQLHHFVAVCFSSLFSPLVCRGCLFDAHGTRARLIAVKIAVWARFELTRSIHLRCCWCLILCGPSLCVSPDL